MGSIDIAKCSGVKHGPLALSNSPSVKQAEAAAKHGPRLEMATIRDDDERMLAQIGYKQVRPFSNDRASNGG